MFKKYSISFYFFHFAFLACISYCKIPKGFINSNVLILGDGDFGFSKALSDMNICKTLIATTRDTKEKLFNSFQNAENNVCSIIKNGDKVHYEIDATDIKINSKFDTIAWNFPHVWRYLEYIS